MPSTSDRAVDVPGAQPLVISDPEIFTAIGSERRRRNAAVELIASENIVSRAVLEAQGSVLTNKYAESYPGRRYGGCYWVDIVETLAIDAGEDSSSAASPTCSRYSGGQAN